MTSELLHFDEVGVASLDGTWEFFPGDSSLEQLDARSPEPIEVPGLWEAQGWLDLDGPAWYRRRFKLESVDGWWSLRFGAVMDRAEVWLNGIPIGTHDNGFTPFALDPGPALHAGDNVLAVRVVDPSVDDEELARSAHGKQGWANHVFPSRPSLYMTYGGIWQSVALRNHGPLVVDDVFVNGDPDDLRVQVAVSNRSDRAVSGVMTLRAAGAVRTLPVQLAAGEGRTHELALGGSPAARWSPRNPTLHEATADLTVDGAPSDSKRVRFGLRTVRVNGTRVFVNDEHYRMKSALVQGFRATELYGQGSRDLIETEVRSALAMGFNTLRLHIKAFEPAYLDVCDELGIFLHCDIPVAEPVATEELGARGESVLAERCASAVEQQIRRDRNHPSIIIWSVMNELGLDRIGVRETDRYERFARALVKAAVEVDPTRPVIENDWVEPDPARVFLGDVLTAHWYGRLHAEYLRKLERQCELWKDLDRPLFVTEFGDWGLPEMPDVPNPPFWDSRAAYVAGLAQTRWPGQIGRFVRETQRYQGLSDRLQAEVFRRHDNIAGYCVTELTDVPQELNGLLDLQRRPKARAVEEMTRANQTVLPMLRLDSLVTAAGAPLEASLHVANDGVALDDVVIEACFADTAPPIPMDRLLELDTSDQDAETILARFEQTTWAIRLGRLEANTTTEVGRVHLTSPRFTGAHDLVVSVRSRDTRIAANRYPIHVVPHGKVDGPTVRLIGESPATAAAIDSLGGSLSEGGQAVVGEDALGAPEGEEIARRLDAGETVVVLAQSLERAAHYPVPIALRAMGTKWGSSVFHFTTDSGALPALPRRNMLAAEDSTVQATSIVTLVDGMPFPDVPVVLAYKPIPDSVAGTVIGSHPVGNGRLVFCQYRLSQPTAKDDYAARAVLGDLLRWAGTPRPVLTEEPACRMDGRAVARYSHDWRRAE